MLWCSVSQNPQATRRQHRLIKKLYFILQKPQNESYALEIQQFHFQEFQALEPVSEEATFVWKNDDGIILLCVHLDYNAGILERKQFSKLLSPATCS
ncbi:uncharacterized protein LOC144302977 isoform X2 [Canis aureus]